MILCKVLDVVRSGYYDYFNRLVKPISSRELKDVKMIQDLYDKSGGTYGAKRIAGGLGTKRTLLTISVSQD
ncbi:hypothetical protein [Sporosarcina psychrophila]|uniref:hypothetical protein n=1 Tax=Sporosarcina psychrophila TaxID=1476 RepID=UPI00078B95A4|nr:hypothetical protein [Sporosarcina psychrophila]AMQ06208.1 hypothetical protein AZE41_09860 [Sporosarcina psychrophila]